MPIRLWFVRIAIIVFAFQLQSCQKSKTGYIDTFKLVSEFELQKEYSAQARKELEQARAAIDSLLFIEKIQDTTRMNLMKNELYNALSQKAEEHNRDIEKIIWNRLNPYIKDYGKANDYQFIYGANGTGNILYAADNKDITEDVIGYVNKRYHDKQ